MSQTIGIASKIKHPRSEEMIRQFLLIIKKHTDSILVDEETYLSFKKCFNGNQHCKSCKRSELINSCNMVVVFGGDGTLISVARHSRSSQKVSPKILGVNLGNLGFLTEVYPEDLEKAVNAYFLNEIKLSRTYLLEILVENESTLEKQSQQYYAINDVVINKQALARIFALGLIVNDNFATQIRGDGMIISSPNGSTAYSLAAGGSIVHPEVDALLITPICPHSLTSRPIVIPGNAKIRLELDSNSRAEEVFLTIDGQEGLAIHQGAKIHIKKSSHFFEFVRLNSSNYFSNLSNKLRWG